MYQDVSYASDLRLVLSASVRRKHGEAAIILRAEVVHKLTFNKICDLF